MKIYPCKGGVQIGSIEGPLHSIQITGTKITLIMGHPRDQKQIAIEINTVELEAKNAGFVEF